MRFDACASSYDENAKPQRFFAERVAQFINTSVAQQPRGATSILELGAGTGALTRCLCTLGCSAILATDASPAMVRYGRTAVPAASWSVLDAFAGPIPSAALQVSSGLLHWAREPADMLARWKSFLPEGGRMIHAIPCDPCLAEWRAIVPDSPVLWRDAAGWRSVFITAGLQVCRSQLWTHQAVAYSAIELVRGFHRSGVTGGVRIGPGRLRRALRDYDLRNRTPAGTVATWAWLAIEAM
jgi:SAM-dependent methyltransferase